MSTRVWMRDAVILPLVLRTSAAAGPECDAGFCLITRHHLPRRRGEAGGVAEDEALLADQFAAQTPDKSSRFLGRAFAAIVGPLSSELAPGRIHICGTGMVRWCQN